uniref:Uncharacterized protein n=1 Tax=Arundo donax TaxID=35708 RepID=A0A0A9G1Q8_ARUDO
MEHKLPASLHMHVSTTNAVRWSEANILSFCGR